jgi:hypothetical protein
MSADDWDRGFLLMSRGFGVVADPPDLTRLAPPALVLVGGQDTTTPPSLATAVAERLRERPGGECLLLLLLHCWCCLRSHLVACCAILELHKLHTCLSRCCAVPNPPLLSDCPSIAMRWPSLLPLHT